MIKLVCMYSLSKSHCSKLNNKLKCFRFSSQKNLSTTTFPYVFGGLSNVPFKQNLPSFLTLKQIFSDDTLEGFKDAYKYVLYSFAQKDIQGLQSVCEQNLTRKLNLKNLSLINPDAPIEVVCGKSFRSFGATFVREDSIELKQMFGQDENIFYLNLGLMNSNNPGSIMKYMSGGLPILLSYEILFRSTMKLVPEGSSKNQKSSQIHSMQFQVQGSMNLMKYMKMAIAMNAENGKINSDEAKTILKQMVGNNYEWKVGDIDRALNGNFKIIA